MALSGNRPRASRCRDAPKSLTNAGAPMTADVTQDRRVTERRHGSSDSAFIDGSRLFWALPSPVHERLGSGSPHPTGYKLMRCLPHEPRHGPVQDVTSSHSQRAPKRSDQEVSRHARRRQGRYAPPPAVALWPALTAAALGAAVNHRNARATPSASRSTITTMSKACPDQSSPLTTTPHTSLRELWRGSRLLQFINEFLRGIVMLNKHPNFQTSIRHALPSICLAPLLKVAAPSKYTPSLD